MTQVEPLHFYKSKACDISMVLAVTPAEVLYVSYESEEPGLVAELPRAEFVARHERVPSPYHRQTQPPASRPSVH